MRKTPTTIALKKEAFAREYLVDMKVGRAAKAAGICADTATRWLKSDPEVAKHLTVFRQQVQARTSASVDRVVEELTRIALHDLAGCYGKDGRLLPMHEMPEEARRALAGLDVEEHALALTDPETGDPLTSTVKKVRTLDKLRALELLGKHLGMWKDDAGPSSNVTIQIAGIIPPSSSTK